MDKCPYNIYLVHTLLTIVNKSLPIADLGWAKNKNDTSITI